eukprot:TRINITY_DN7265_c0_g1_i3.p1 TRINITY_DN7265_c0_g1~~TRINITY_DN7265_c0_g1_i3.p1  ORF type:complete len:150 (+),score=58.81 TRINITY_DN7265_c0_g1_i3:116-565(+)
MITLKSRMNTLDGTILTIADKFTGITDLIQRIDKKFDSDKDRILAEDGMIEEEKSLDLQKQVIHTTVDAPSWEREKMDEEKLGRKITVTKKIEYDLEYEQDEEINNNDDNKNNDNDDNINTNNDKTTERHNNNEVNNDLNQDKENTRHQ